ncbi:DUF4234 domain-containing protein [Pseudomonas chlororaphis]|uniref:DUF4234 domain-containing protein n=1 Tax=Pseudomonas chlororaphis TaxID=587753 RepID=UPI0015DEE882|nr:DUF4234 domain-containing protein [Pseudomonas chlororaphis]QLL12493.1 DUF4234 domain-containing protein [Pseudomonas chlororaphis subsp. aurantiaca]
MSDNLYAPPQAELATASEVQRPFYVVSRTKFLTLFLLTLGIYQLYWAYKNWQQFKQATGQEMWPIARALFAIFFTHALYREGDAKIKASGRTFDWRPGELATLFVIMVIVSNVIDGLVRKNIGFPLLDLFSLALLPVHAWITYLGQRGLNEAAGDPLGESNARFTPINYVFIVLGALVWALALFGLTLPPE